MICFLSYFFFSSRIRHTRLTCDWSSDVCSSDLYRVHAEDHRDVQPRVVDRVVLERVVPLGPAPPGVADRVVGTAGEDRAGEVLDQHVVHAGRLQRVGVATGVGALAVGRVRLVPERADDDLVHLADLLLQRHPAQQVLDARGHAGARIAIDVAGGPGYRRLPARDEDGRDEDGHGQVAGTGFPRQAAVRDQLTR